MITEQALRETINFLKYKHGCSTGWVNNEVLSVIKTCKDVKYEDYKDGFILDYFLVKPDDDVVGNYIDCYYKGWKLIPILTDEERIIKDIIE